MPRLSKPEDKFLDFNRLPAIYFRMKVEGAAGPVLIYQSLGRIDVATARRVRDALVQTIDGASICSRLGLPIPENEIATKFGVQGMLERLGRAKRRQAEPTLDEVFAAYEVAASEAEQPLKTKSIYTAQASLKTILKRVLGVREPGALRVSVLADQAGEDLARDYRAGMIAERREEWEEICLERGGEPDLELLQEMMDSCRRTIKSTLSQARSIFAPEHRQHAAMRALALPNVEPFRELVVRGSTIRQYDPLPEVVRERIRQDLAALRAERPAVWRAFVLGAEAGLRRSSAELARWDWFEVPAAGDVVLHVRVAKRRGYRLPVPRSVYDALRVGATGDYVVPGAAEERSAVFDELVQWLRARGVDRDKPNYELRKWFGWHSERVLGFEQAWKRLGHANDRSARAYMRPEASDSTTVAL